ncbi:DUF58 domain-containing protein [Endozoicomonas ascidiicola]|uniref:DUF58 domain-containing protein n=1 Tax=Endozoicomonas ascidiicola TaxID=1698521 RepID=UPI0008326548|nr:DUF58 domain-containing protein [Endozoicomonas ascidiicola]
MSGAYCTLQSLVNLRLQAKDLTLFKSGRSLHQMFGGVRSPFKGRGVDFEEVRAYQFGDDIRSIDWRVTARRMKPHTKIFQEERERPVMILLDQRHSLFFGSRLNFKSVTAAEIAALIAWATLNHGDRIGGVIFNEQELQETRPKRSRKTLMHWLNQTEIMNRKLSLAAVASHDAANGMARALRHVRRVTHPGTQIFFISDFQHMNEESAQHLAQLARNNEVMAINVSDPLEQELPKPDQYRITDGLHTLTVNTGRSELRRQFQHNYQQQQEQLQSLLSRYRIPLIQASAAEPTAMQMLGSRALTPKPVSAREPS